MKAWKVIIDGVDTGIIETNYPFALRYWTWCAARRQYRVRLQEIDT